MRWLWKTSRFKADKLKGLLKHYKLRHGVVSRGQTVPCLYTNFACSFKTFNALQAHLSRQHPEKLTSIEVLSFECVLCRSSCFDSERPYFEHLGSHLRRFEVVAYVFKNCSFSTNIYSTFATHRHSKLSRHGLEDFKTEVLKKYPDSAVAQHEPLFVTDGEDPEPAVKCCRGLPLAHGHYLRSELDLPTKDIWSVPKALSWAWCSQTITQSSVTAKQTCVSADVWHYFKRSCSCIWSLDGQSYS